MKTKIFSMLVFLTFLFGICSIEAKLPEQHVSDANLVLAQDLEEKVSLKETLNRIESGYDITFLYESDLVNGKVGSAETFDGPLRSVIEGVLKPHDLESKYIENRTFVISKMEKPELEAVADSVTGVVIDQETNQT